MPGAAKDGRSGAAAAPAAAGLEVPAPPDRISPSHLPAFRRPHLAIPPCALARMPARRLRASRGLRGPPGRGMPTRPAGAARPPPPATGRTGPGRGMPPRPAGARSAALPRPAAGRGLRGPHPPAAIEPSADPPRRIRGGSAGSGCATPPAGDRALPRRRGSRQPRHARRSPTAA